MSLAAPTWSAIPSDTVHAARAAFPKGTLALHLREHLGTLYTDGLFADLFSPLGWCSCGRPRLLRGTT